MDFRNSKTLFKRIAASSWPMYLTIAAIILTYAYYAGMITYLPPSRDSKPDYMLMLGNALLSGHTYIDDDLARHLHNSLALNPDGSALYVRDTSFYKGHYYVYWGPVPLLLIWLPVKLLTGISVSSGFMGFVLASLGTACLAVMLFRMAKRLEVPPWAALPAVLSIAYGTWIPFVLRGARLYEVPALGAYAFTALGLLCCWQYWERMKPLWVGGASLSFILAVGCRVNIIFNTIFLLLLLLLAIRLGASRRRLLAVFLYAAMPWIAGLGLYGAYNYARFDSPFDIGIRHQMSYLDWSRPDFRLFMPEQALVHGYLYLLNPLPLRTPLEFPFFSPASVWKKMTVPWLPGYLHLTEPTFGLLTNSPFALFGLLAWPAWKRRSEWSPPLRIAVTGLLLFSGIVFGFFLLHYYATQRYELDFAPWIMSLSGICYLLSLHAHANNTRRRRALLVLGSVLAAWGLCTGLLSGYCGYFRC